MDSSNFINKRRINIRKPIPFINEDVENVFWKPEEWDKNLPSNGFITDFVLALRGIKTPTKFTTWSALYLISSVLKRDAWLEWGPLSFFANLFVVLVGPSATGKSSAANWGINKVLSTFHGHIKDPMLREKKKVNILRSKSTAEGIFTLLEKVSSTGTILTSPGKYNPVELGANVAMGISELATFLGRQQYNIGLIEKLTDLYDCKDIDDDTTSGRGQRLLKNLYITLFGCTTADGLRDSIPEAAFGDGFLSRLILVYQDSLTRSYSRPMRVMGGPSVEDLSYRLAWIANNARGLFTLSTTAASFYDVWYNDVYMKKYVNDSEVKQYTRFDIHLLKTSMLLRAQRYEEGTVITLQDVKEALTMLEQTFNDSHHATDDIGSTYFHRCLKRVRDGIKRRKKLSRKAILRYNSRNYNAQIIHQVLQQLYQEEHINIYQGTKRMSMVSTVGTEIYEWKED